MNAGKLLKYIRDIKSLCITGQEDFGESSHSVYSEPFYYEMAYKDPVPNYSLKVDRENRCIAIEKSHLTNILIPIATLCPLIKMV